MAKLTENLIREISGRRNEPQWLLQWRLDAFTAWTKMHEPHWGILEYPHLDYDALNYYNEPAQLWTLRGNVKAMNLQGEQFETPLLYWDQQSESVYSDSSIIITRATSIIKGVGFRSNQEMTQYTILRPSGVFPIEE